MATILHFVRPDNTPPNYPGEKSEYIIILEEGEDMSEEPRHGFELQRTINILEDGDVHTLPTDTVLWPD